MPETRRITGGDLFDPKFMESLGSLRITARRVPRHGRHAEQRSQDMGSGNEFKDFRPYSTGDDFRSIDWNIYQRLGRVVLRLFDELEDLPLYLAPDVSASAFLEEPPRALAGLRAALALASISLGQHDRVGIYAFADDVRVVQPPMSGKNRVLQMAERLASIEPGGATDFRRSFGHLAAMDLRPGLLAIFSDFFDPAGIDAVIESLKSIRHRLLLVRLVRRSDRDPDLSGDLRLRDCETGAAEDLSITPSLLARYREAYATFEKKLDDFIVSHRALELRLDVEADVVAQLAELFEAGSLRV